MGEENLTFDTGGLVIPGVSKDLTFDEATHTYRAGDVVIPGVSQVLKDSGLIDTSWYTEEARRRGGLVHTAIHYEIQGDLDWSSLDERIKGYVYAFKAFCLATGFRIVASEQRVYDPIYRYAGTLDFHGFMADDETPTLVDIKHGGIEPWCALQTSGYARCIPTKPIHRVGLQLREEGTYRMHPYSDVNDERIFLSAVSLWWWKQRNGGRNGNV